MPANFLPSSLDYLRFLPETILTAAGTIVMLLAAFLKGPRKNGLAYFTLASLAASIAAAWIAGQNPGYAFSNMLIVDGFATFFRILVLAVGVLTVLCSSKYLQNEKAGAGEFYALILFSLAGQCVMAAANNLIMVFIGLEISSIATYVLAGYLRDDKRNNEAAIKYFLLGSFATAFLLYGIAWIYGVTGSTNLDQIRYALMSGQVPPDSVLVGVSAALLFVGFAFKVSAAPFQIWTPDVYQGAPAPVTLFMSAAPQSRRLRHFPARLHHRVPAPQRPLGAVRLVLRPAHHDRRQLRRPLSNQHQAHARL